MYRVAIVSLLATATLLTTNNLGAAVVTIEGTIKSVDLKKRTLILDTGTESKTLDVSSKVKVTVETKEANLESLKAGQKVKLSYHDELEIVLKIDVASEHAGDAQPSEDGWISLFNGKDLTGWTVAKGEPGTWLVKDGDIVGVPPGDALDQWLFTDNDYDNIVLRFEYRLRSNAKASSGITFRALPIDSKFRPIKLMDDGDVNSDERTGSVWAEASTAPPKRNAKLKPGGEWNDAELVLDGKLLKLSINGEQVQNLDLAEFAKQAGNFPTLTRASGRIGLQAHTSIVRFRSIRIRKLSGVAAPAATTPSTYLNHPPGLIWSMPIGPDWWHRAAISPTGNYIAAGRLSESGKDKQSVRIHLWPMNDAQDGSQSFVVRHPLDGKRERNTIEGLVFAPNGKMLASSALDGSICLWDVTATTPKMLSRIQPYDWCVDGLDISPDGRLLAAVGRNPGVPVKVWDISNPAEPRETAALEQNKKAMVDSLAFSRTGHTLLLAPMVPDTEARVLAWDYENGKSTRTVWKGPASKSWIRWLRQSPDGDRLGFGLEDRAYVIDARSGEILTTFAGHGKTVNGIVFTPDGERCVTSSYDGTIRMWSAKTGLQLWQNDQFHGVNEGLAVSPDGRLVFTTSHGSGSPPDPNGNLAQLWRLPDPPAPSSN